MTRYAFSEEERDLFIEERVALKRQKSVCSATRVLVR